MQEHLYVKVITIRSVSGKNAFSGKKSIDATSIAKEKQQQQQQKHSEGIAPCLRF